MYLSLILEHITLAAGSLTHTLPAVSNPRQQSSLDSLIAQYSNLSTMEGGGSRIYVTWSTSNSIINADPFLLL